MLKHSRPIKDLISRGAHMCMDGEKRQLQPIALHCNFIGLEEMEYSS